MTYLEDEIVQDKLTTKEQALLKQIKAFLEVIKQSTKSLEGFKHGLDHVLPSIDFILAHFEKAKETYTNNEKIKTIVNTRQQKMNKYYNKTDQSPAYVTTLLLNPSRKW